MSARRVTEGRRYTRRAADVHDTEHGELRTYAIDADEAPTHAACARLQAEAVAALEAQGVPAARMLAEQGAGMLRDYVLNRADHAPDTRAGLAARLLVAIEFAEALSQVPARPRHAMLAGYELGRLVALWRVYAIDDAQRAAAAKAQRPARRDPMRAELVEDLRRFRKAEHTLAEALAALADRAHGLRVRADGAGYRVTDESGARARCRVLSRRTLDALWLEAGRPRTRD